jgi:hypothetical protein
LRRELHLVNTSNISATEKSAKDIVVREMIMSPTWSSLSSYSGQLLPLASSISHLGIQSPGTVARYRQLFPLYDDMTFHAYMSLACRADRPREACD